MRQRCGANRRHIGEFADLVRVPIGETAFLAMPSAAVHVPASPTLARAFGRFQLRRLLGKSETTMAWLALDSRAGLETMLTMPRIAPASPAGAHRSQPGDRRIRRGRREQEDSVPAGQGTEERRVVPANVCFGWRRQ